MKILHKYSVPEDHVGVLFEDELFARILVSGVYRMGGLLKSRRLAIYDTRPLSSQVVPEDVLQLAERYSAELEPLLQRWQTGAYQVGLLYRDDVLIDVLPPAQRGAYWISTRPVEVRMLDITDSGEVEPALARLLRGARGSALRKSVTAAAVTLSVPEGHVGFLYIDGKRMSVLQAGAHMWWKFDRDITGHMVDCRLQNMEVNGQEILTADKVSLRVNLSATWRVVDAEKVIEALADHNDFLYRELQLALRTVVSTRSLDELLEDKNLLNAQVRDLVSQRVSDFGLELGTVGARDIVLPGEMKEILSQVVEAQKRAEANLIQRREETQATRSLHNTAKVMEGNPTLLRLKELEILEKVSAQIGTLNVYGGLNGVMNELVTLQDSPVRPRS